MKTGAWHPWQTKNVAVSYDFRGLNGWMKKKSVPDASYDWLFVFAHLSHVEDPESAPDAFTNEMLLPLGWFAGDIAFPKTAIVGFRPKHVFDGIFGAGFDEYLNRRRFYVWSNDAQEWCVHDESDRSLLVDADHRTEALYREGNHDNYNIVSPAPAPYDKPWRETHAICYAKNDPLVKRWPPAMQAHYPFTMYGSPVLCPFSGE